MPTTRDDVRAALSVHDPEALRAILAAAGAWELGASTSGELADRIAQAIWWNATTPLGFAAGRASLEDIVGKVARRLSVSDKLGAGDAWEQLDDMTRALVHTLPENPGIALSDVDPGMRKRLKPHWKRTVAFGGGAGTSYGARVASGAVLGFLEGPLGRLLPLIPPLAPYVKGIRVGAGTVHMVSGPLGIAFAVLSANQALGPSYRTLLPLLLGIGALGVRPVDEAAEVDSQEAPA